MIARRAVPQAVLPLSVIRCPRALDLGAGAGVSTEILWPNRRNCQEARGRWKAADTYTFARKTGCSKYFALQAQR